jgi:hypothetical protein
MAHVVNGSASIVQGSARDTSSCSVRGAVRFHLHILVFDVVHVESNRKMQRRKLTNILQVIYPRSQHNSASQSREAITERIQAGRSRGRRFELDSLALQWHHFPFRANIRIGLVPSAHAHIHAYFLTCRSELEI